MDKKIKVIIVTMLTILFILCIAVFVVEYLYPFQEPLMRLFIPEPSRP